jgi:uncharacterized protein
MDQSLVKGVYDVAIDRVSAYEILEQRGQQAAAASAAPEVPDLSDFFGRGGDSAPSRSSEKAPSRRASTRQTPLEAFATTTMRSLGTQIGRQLVRGIMGSLQGGSTRSRK